MYMVWVHIFGVPVRRSVAQAACRLWWWLTSAGNQDQNLLVGMPVAAEYTPRPSERLHTLEVPLKCTVLQAAVQAVGMQRGREGPLGEGHQRGHRPGHQWHHSKGVQAQLDPSLLMCFKS